MFLIVDNTRRKMRQEIKFRFNELNIPCIVTDLDHCNDYMPAALVIVTEKYLMDDVKFLADMYDKTPVILWDGTADILKLAFDTYEEIYGVRILNSTKSRILFDGDEIYYGGRRMFFTKTETRILYFIYYMPGWQEKEHIAKYCLSKGKRDADAVPVHICNINNQANRRTFSKMISFKRFKGYKI